MADDDGLESAVYSIFVDIQNVVHNYGGVVPGTPGYAARFRTQALGEMERRVRDLHDDLLWDGVRELILQVGSDENFGRSASTGTGTGDSDDGDADSEREGPEIRVDNDDPEQVDLRLPEDNEESSSSSTSFGGVDRPLFDRATQTEAPSHNVNVNALPPTQAPNGAPNAQRTPLSTVRDGAGNRQPLGSTASGQQQAQNKVTDETWASKRKRSTTPPPEDPSQADAKRQKTRNDRAGTGRIQAELEAQNKMQNTTGTSSVRQDDSNRRTSLQPCGDFRITGTTTDVPMYPWGSSWRFKCDRCGRLARAKKDFTSHMNHGHKEERDESIGTGFAVTTTYPETKQWKGTYHGDPKKKVSGPMEFDKKYSVERPNTGSDPPSDADAAYGVDAATRRDLKVVDKPQKGRNARDRGRKKTLGLIPEGLARGLADEAQEDDGEQATGEPEDTEQTAPGSGVDEKEEDNEAEEHTGEADAEGSEGPASDDGDVDVSAEDDEADD